MFFEVAYFLRFWKKNFVFLQKRKKYAHSEGAKRFFAVQKSVLPLRSELLAKNCKNGFSFFGIFAPSVQKCLKTKPVFTFFASSHLENTRGFLPLVLVQRTLYLGLPSANADRRTSIAIDSIVKLDSKLASSLLV